MMSNELQKLGLVPFFTQQIADASLPESRLGRVTSVQRSIITVTCNEGKRSVGLSRILQQAAAVDRPTVGDWIVLDETLARIEQVLERKSLFKRIGIGVELGDGDAASYVSDGNRVYYAPASGMIAGCESYNLADSVSVSGGSCQNDIPANLLNNALARTALPGFVSNSGKGNGGGTDEESEDGPAERGSGGGGGSFGWLQLCLLALLRMGKFRRACKIVATPGQPSPATTGPG